MRTVSFCHRASAESPIAQSYLSEQETSAARLRRRRRKHRRRDSLHRPACSRAVVHELLIAQVEGRRRVEEVAGRAAAARAADDVLRLAAPGDYLLAQPRRLCVHQAEVDARRAAARLRDTGTNTRLRTRARVEPPRLVDGPAALPKLPRRRAAVRARLGHRVLRRFEVAAVQQRPAEGAGRIQSPAHAVAGARAGERCFEGRAGGRGVADVAVQLRRKKAARRSGTAVRRR